MAYLMDYDRACDNVDRCTKRATQILMSTWNLRHGYYCASCGQKVLATLNEAEARGAKQQHDIMKAQDVMRDRQ